MKKHLLRQVAAVCLLAPATGLLILPAAAALNVAAASAPQTRGLEVNADSGLSPGSQLRLTLEASPGGNATARIPGVDVAIQLKEGPPGQYNGRYTVRRSDRIDPAAVIRVSFRAGDRTIAANYTFPPSFATRVAVAEAPSLQIERFAVAPVGRAGPGAELVFRLNGMPGATAWLDIPGIASHVAMRETQPGHYEGIYVVRQGDNLGAAGLVNATLRSDDNRVVTATLRQPLVNDHGPTLEASDRAGERAQKPWSFEVDGSVPGTPSAVLPLMVMSHQNNAMVGQDVTTVRGRTAPFATVRVRVDAVSPPGRRADAGVAQRLLSETVQADANGDFSFDFTARYTQDNATSLPVPGTRYEVSITANRDNVTSESRLLLLQRS